MSGTFLESARADAVVFECGVSCLFVLMMFGCFLMSYSLPCFRRRLAYPLLVLIAIALRFLWFSFAEIVNCMKSCCPGLVLSDPHVIDQNIL